MKVVLVGCGGISRAWMEAARAFPEIEMAGFVDIDSAAAEKCAATWARPGAKTGTDLKGMLASVRPEVVFNCTTPEAHASTAIAALESGSHVLIEKPLADTMPNAGAMIAAARSAGRTLAVTQNRRYQKGIRRLKAFLDSGAVGRTGTVHSDFMIGAHFGGFRDRMAHVLLLDMAIHTIDAARLLIGADPKAVTCVEWNPHGSWYDRDASAVAVFEMADGCVYTYRGSWCAEGLNTSWECDWRVIGENGTVKWDGGDGFAAQAVAERGGFHSRWRDVEVPPADAGGKDGGHGGVMREFIECVRNGTAPETSADDNVKSLAMVLAAIESSETGRKVDVKWG